jgi:ABC-2 type transport system permease protein
MTELARLVVRVLALVGKEITEVVRRPGAVLSLILGPFLILAVFGFGYEGFKRDLVALIVVEPGSTLPTDLASYQSMTPRGITIAGIVPDRAAGEAQLRTGAIDVVIVPPRDPLAEVEAGRQADVTFITDITDPIAANYAAFLADTMSAAINRQIYTAGAQQGQAYAIKIGGKDISNIPPEVIASPTRAVFENIAPATPTIVGFYGPAALALILQHMAVTLVALSIVRERASGALDRFRTSPMRATEVLAGKVLAFGLLGAVIAVISVWLLVTVLGVPMLASPIAIALVLGFLLLASLGLGMLISVISDSERQAVQLSLLTLLASVFFSGFVLPIDEFVPAVQVAVGILPVTHGINLLQSAMLTGTISAPWHFVALAVIGMLFLAVSWAFLRRELRPA